MLRTLAALFTITLSACASGGPVASTASPAPSDMRVEDAARDGGYDPRLRASPPATPALASPVVVPLDAAMLAALPRESVTATAQGASLRCEGVVLSALLRATGAMPDGPLRGAQLARYVQVDGRGGERVLFALAELDPTLGNRRVFIVDRCDCKPLGDDDGPLRLVTADEARPARSLRQVEAITVIVAP